MDILKTGAQLLIDKLDLEIDPNTAIQALSSLLGDGKGNVDFGALAARMASSGNFSSLIGSWLGDGANQAISAEGITTLLGPENIDNFASRLGTDRAKAADGLAEVLPEMVDKASAGGSLLDKVGGAKGIAGFAKSLFNR